jgi:hypothetical protein
VVLVSGSAGASVSDSARLSGTMWVRFREPLALRLLLKRASRSGSLLGAFLSVVLQGRRGSGSGGGPAEEPASAPHCQSCRRSPVRRELLPPPRYCPDSSLASFVEGSLVIHSSHRRAKPFGCCLRERRLLRHVSTRRHTAGVRPKTSTPASPLPIGRSFCSRLFGCCSICQACDRQLQGQSSTVRWYFKSSHSIER